MNPAIDHRFESEGTGHPPADYSTAKRRIVVFLVVYDVALAVACVFMPKDNQVVDYIVGLPVLIPTLIWCHLDAKERNISISILMKLCLVFLFVISFPIYVFRTQGLRGWGTLTFAIFFGSGVVVLLLIRFF